MAAMNRSTEPLTPCTVHAGGTASGSIVGVVEPGTATVVTGTNAIVVGATVVSRGPVVTTVVAGASEVGANVVGVVVGVLATVVATVVVSGVNATVVAVAELGASNVASGPAGSALEDDPHPASTATSSAGEASFTRLVLVMIPPRGMP
jgi:hypothetical protein